MPSCRMAVYLHADEGPPDYVTENPKIIAEVVKAFGRHRSQLVIARDLARHLDSPISRRLAREEGASMVRVLMDEMSAP